MTRPHAPQVIQPSGFFVLRTPLAPLDDLVSWSEGLEAATAPEGQLAAALSRDRLALRARLLGRLEWPEVREAIFVASPSLDESLDVWRADPDGERGQRVERALVRYLARLAGRATPFGLFAGCSLGAIGGSSRLEIAGLGQYRRHTRLDADYLFALTDALARDKALRRFFLYRPNSSLYRSAGRLHYVESRLDGTLRSYHLVAVEPSEALDATLGRAADGAEHGALAAALVDDEVSRAEAEDFLAELIDGQILVPDLAVPVTGREPIHVMVDELGGRPETASVAAPLAEARDELERIDSAGLGLPCERYRAIARALEPLPAKLDISRLFQIDMTKPAPHATLGGPVLAEIVRGVELLRRLTRSRRGAEFERFREAFRERYEQQEVPLVEALDEETGIGFAGASDTSPLLKDLPSPSPQPADVAWGPREALLLRRLGEALGSGRGEIALDAEDVDGLAAKDGLPLPRAFAATATIAASSPQALDDGDFRVVLHGLSGPSGALLLGRFCHADEALRRLVVEHLRAEEESDKDAVFAEIAHLPEGRLGNILMRPVLREYEIAYLGRSGAPLERQIPITDLRVSVAGEEVVLRSERLGRRVIPRLTTAHAYGRAHLGIYRFLCELQRQGVVAGAGWDWGPLARAPFLPRVTSGRLVLCRARWNVHKDELRRLGRGDAVARFREAQSWRASRRLPRFVVLADGDNALPVDLSNALSVESFVQLVKDRDEAALDELFPGPEELCAHGPEGRFVHELVVPFVSSAAPRRHSASDTAVPGLPRDSASAPRACRSHPPGSEWLYVKLYSGTATADEVLRELVGPLVRQALGAGEAQRWFFIRYHDPDPHLRLRFQGAPESLERRVWPALRAAAQPCLEDGRIRRLCLDTYEREIERYGGPDGVGLAEELFHADSQAVLEIVERLDPGDAGLDERWRLAFCGMHRLLEDLGIELEARAALLQEIRAASAREQRFDRATERRLGDRFRKERAGLEALLQASPAGDHPLAPGLLALDRRSRRLRTVVAELRDREAAGRLTAPRRSLAVRFLHMHANRLLRSVQRQQEAVLHDFLARHYESALARQRRSEPLALTLGRQRA
jgi:thiopeptide-type bacteriocin biosynthesis protein